MHRRIIQIGDRGQYFINRSFQWFVLQNQDEQEVVKWINEQRASLWSSLRLGIVLLAALFSFGVLYVGQGLSQSYISYVTAVGGALLTAFELGRDLLMRRGTANRQESGRRSRSRRNEPRT